MSVLQIRKGSADVLVFYPPEDTAPATASLTITDVNGSALSGFAWPRTVDRDSASATVSVAASQGARAISVSSNTGFVIDETYLLTEATTGQKYRVRVAGVPSGKVVLDQPIPIALTTAATLTGLAYRFTTNATMTADVRRRCRAQWSYTAGTARYHQQRLDIVREPWTLALTESDVEAYDHTFGETAGSSGRWRTLIQGVSDDLMRWLEQRRLYADLLKDRDFIKRAACLLLLSRFYGTRPGDDNAKIATKWRKEYETALVELSSASLWYDADDDDSLDGASGDGVTHLGDDDEDDETSESGELGLPGNYAAVG
jgi:hypothetical protein